MHILNKGIMEVRETSFIKKIFCKHEYVTGENCSSNGLVCISGEHLIKVCKRCGKVKGESFQKY